MNDEPRPMFRRRTDKIYATLQDVQRRMSQGTEQGEASSERTAFTATPSHAPTDHRSWSASHGGTSSGYMVRPDGQRVPVEGQQEGGSAHSSSPPTSMPSVAPPNHPLHPDQARRGTRPSPTIEPGPPVAQQPPPAPYQEVPPTAVPPPAQEAPAHSSRGDRPEREGLTMGGRGEGGSAGSANPALDLAASESRPRRLVLSVELATVLAIVWVATLAVAFFVGRGQFIGDGFDQIDDGGSTAGSGVEARGGGEDHQDVDLAGNGTEVLLLESVGRFSSDAQAAFQAKAERYNASARNGGIDPLFGVRRPRSGGLQFVYGKIGTGFGIRSDDARGERIHRALASKFPERRWIDIGD